MIKITGKETVHIFLETLHKFFLKTFWKLMNSHKKQKESLSISYDYAITYSGIRFR